jgi:hypothetical protein
MNKTGMSREGKNKTEEAGQGGIGYCMLGQDMKEQHSIGQDRGEEDRMG